MSTPREGLRAVLGLDPAAWNTIVRNAQQGSKDAQAAIYAAINVAGNALGGLGGFFDDVVRRRAQSAASAVDERASQLTRTAAGQRPAPRPQFGPGAVRPAETTRTVNQPFTRQVSSPAASVTPAVTRTQPQYRGAASTAPAPAPRGWGQEAPRTPTPYTVGPRPAGRDVPGVPPNYFEGSTFVEGVPNPWSTAPTASRLEPFDFSQAVSPSAASQGTPLLAPGIEPIQGRQLPLDLRQRAGAEALVDFMTSRGNIRPAGTKIGGQVFSQAPFNVPTAADSYLTGPGGRNLVPLPDSEEYATAAFGPAQDIRAKLSSWGLDPAQVDTIIAQYSPTRNVMGGVTDSINLMDAQASAGRGLRTAPLAAGGLATLGGLGIGVAMLDRQNQIPSLIEPARAPGSTPLGDPTATIDAGENLPAVTGAPLTAPPAPLPGATNAIPGTVNPSSLTAPAAPLLRPTTQAPAAPTSPVVSSMGAGSVTQEFRGGDSDYRQAVQNAAQGLREDMGSYGPGQAGKFYASQRAYARTPGQDAKIIEALRGMGAPAAAGIETDTALTTWAKQNPELAYALQLRMQRRGPSQQMPVAQGAQIGTTLGTNFQNNAVGQSQAAAQNAVTGTQGAADMADALRPQSYATLQAPRSAMYAGY